MQHEHDDAVQWLERWRDGDAEALGALLASELGWMRKFVREHASPALRRRADSMDFVQDGAVQLLRCRLRFAPQSRAQFRRYTARVLLNVIRDRFDKLTALKRGPGREHALPSEFELGGDAPEPGARLERDELRAWMHRVLSTLSADERRLVQLVHFEQRSYASVADELGLSSPDAARMRWSSLCARIARRLRKERNGRDAWSCS